MATSYQLVFDPFSSKIKDKMFVELTQVDSEDQMIQLLNDGLIYFKYPKVDIFDKDDTLMQFNITMTTKANYKEIQIISHLMVQAWLDRQVNNIDLIKQKFSDRDFKITSQAAHLDKLLLLQEKQMNKCNRLMKNYYASTDTNTSNLSYLAGEDA